MISTAPRHDMRLIDCDEAEYSSAILEIMNEVIANLV